MAKPLKPVKWRWARNGALLGLLSCLIDLAEWRGQKFASWDAPEGLALNFGYLVAGVVILGFIGLCAGAVRDARAVRRPPGRFGG